MSVRAGIAERVRMLDGLVRYRFGDNPALMEGWASARDPSLRSGQVVLGPFRSKVQQEPEAGGSETLRTAQGRPPKAAWLADDVCAQAARRGG